MWFFTGRKTAQQRLGVEAIGDVMIKCRLRWDGHVERNADADYLGACTRLVVKGKSLVARPKKTWQNTVSADMRLLKIDPGTHSGKHVRATR